MGLISGLSWGSLAAPTVFVCCPDPALAENRWKGSMSGSKGAELRAKVAVKPLLAWKTQDCPKCREVYPALSETEVDIFYTNCIRYYRRGK